MKVVITYEAPNTTVAKENGDVISVWSDTTLQGRDIIEIIHKLYPQMEIVDNRTPA